jgi:hypothetical protein
LFFPVNIFNLSLDSEWPLTSAVSLTHILPQCVNFHLLFIFIYFQPHAAVFSILYLLSTLYTLHNIYFTVNPVVFTSFNLFCSARYVIHTDSLSVIYFRYITRPICISSNSGGSNRRPDDGRLLPKHVEAST